MLLLSRIIRGLLSYQVVLKVTWGDVLEIGFEIHGYWKVNKIKEILTDVTLEI